LNERRRATLLRSLNCDAAYGVWLALSLLLLAFAGLAGTALHSLLEYNRNALLGGQWWRLLTAHFVHLDTRHLLFNLAGFALLWGLFARSFTAVRWLWIAGSSLLAVDAGLWLLNPQVLWYVGLSGALHGLWSAGAWSQLRWRSPTSALPLLLLIAKLGFEHWRGGSAVIGDLPVVIDAHLYGAVGGLLPALWWQLRPRTRGSSL
jgi:rhomboid family GlyGly-CTERM serine protease